MITIKEVNGTTPQKYICTIESVKSVMTFPDFDTMFNFMLEHGGERLSVSKISSHDPEVRLARWNRGRIIYADNGLTREEIADILQIEEDDMMKPMNEIGEQK